MRVEKELQKKQTDLQAVTSGKVRVKEAGIHFEYTTLS